MRIKYFLELTDRVTKRQLIIIVLGIRLTRLLLCFSVLFIELQLHLKLKLFQTELRLEVGMSIHDFPNF